MEKSQAQSTWQIIRRLIPDLKVHKGWLGWFFSQPSSPGSWNSSIPFY